MSDDSKKPTEIRFLYQKARHHRTLHADGAWAGVTPHLEVQFAFFNNLKPMPDVTTQVYREDGTLGLEAIPPTADVIREVDVTVVMNKAAAKATIDLLSQMLKQIEDIETKQKGKTEQESKVQ